MATQGEQLDTVAAFLTPEQSVFSLRLAGPLQRALAYLLDLITRIALLIAFILLLTDFEGGPGLILVLYFAIDWLAGGLCEWLWHGQTPGKRACGIRVLGADGEPAGLAACLLRNFFRFVDSLPAGFLIGLTTMATSRRFTRLGDLVAGTVVVYTGEGGLRQLPAVADPVVLERAAALPAASETVLGAAGLRTLATYVQRRKRYAPARREEMAEELAGPLRRVLQLPPTLSADKLLVAMHARCYLLAASGGGAKAASVLAKRTPQWQQLQKLLSSRRQRAADPEHFARLYRGACADLALAHAYHLPERQIQFLHELVARAHRTFYRRLRFDLRPLAQAIFVRVPARLYGDACTRLALVTFFGSFLAAMLLAIANPHHAEAFVGRAQLDHLLDMYTDAPRGRDFSEASGMGGFYIVNNVGISLACFVSGIFVGIGSLIFLLFNGLVLGFCFGFMAAAAPPSVRENFFEFVSAHGPFELTGIALSGAAGLRLGLGLVVRHGQSLARSLQASARQAFPVAMVAAAFVAAAAPIEAFVSPSDLSLTGKRQIMWLCLILLVLYLVGCGALARHRLQQVPEASE